MSTTAVPPDAKAPASPQTSTSTSSAVGTMSLPSSSNAVAAGSEPDPEDPSSISNLGASTSATTLDAPVLAASPLPTPPLVSSSPAPIISAAASGPGRKGSVGSLETKQPHQHNISSSNGKQTSKYNSSSLDSTTSPSSSSFHYNSSSTNKPSRLGSGLAARIMSPSSSKASLDIANGLRSISAAATGAAAPSSHDRFVAPPLTSSSSTAFMSSSQPTTPAPGIGTGSSSNATSSPSVSKVSTPSGMSTALSSLTHHAPSWIPQLVPLPASVPTPALQPTPSSILLNPLATSAAAGKLSRIAWTAEDPKDGSLRTKIKALPSEQDRMEERARIAREKEKQREKEVREREAIKEKEKEKEVAMQTMLRETSEGKVWGIIPKKALMMGMGDINFNAQMAILGGWGNGSGTQTLLEGKGVDAKKREGEKKRERRKMDEMEKEAIEKQQQQQAQAAAAAAADQDAAKAGGDKAQEEEGEKEDDEPLDPEELAAINAIINTRRSMEAAQALASGQVKMLYRQSPSSAAAGMSASAPTASAGTPTSSHHAAEDDEAAEADSSRRSGTTRRSESIASSKRIAANGGAGVGEGSSPPSSPRTVPAATPMDFKSPRLIRFAPLPAAELDSDDGHAESGSPVDEPGGLSLASALGAGLLSSSLLLGSIASSREASTDVPPPTTQAEETPPTFHQMQIDEAPAAAAATAPTPATPTPMLTPSANSAFGASAESLVPSASSVAAHSPLDVPVPPMQRNDSHFSRRSSTTSLDSEDSYELGRWGKSKWYLMGMPSGIFKPDSYRGLLSAKRKSLLTREEADAHGAEELGAPLARRLSTGALGIATSLLEADRRRASFEGGLRRTLSSRRRAAASGGGHSGDGSTRSRSRTRTRKGSSSGARPPSRSGSGDEDERQRRRELILAQRPGGTGMVTLLDGTKIKARRVDDPGVTGHEELRYDEWGHALLAKEALRNRIEAEAREKAGLPSSPTQDADADPDATMIVKSDEPASQLADEPEQLSLDGSQADLGSPTAAERDRPMPKRKPTTGLGLPLDKVDEVRRRHEQEVAALGWEVIHSVHKQQQAKRQASMSDSVKTGATSATDDDPKQKSGTSTPVLANSGAGASGSVLSLSPRPLSKTMSNETATSPIQKAADISASASSRGRTGARGSSAAVSSPSRRASSKQRVDASISVPVPGAVLPRKPDARGHVVVALPHSQLGMRPERPQEGRSWIHADGLLGAESSDEDDEAPKTPVPEVDHVAAQRDAERATAAAAGRRGSKDGNESESEGLNPEEQAEEDRKTAIQKKRLTTRAAGQEIVMRNKGRVPSSSRRREASASERAVASPASQDADANTDIDGDDIGDENSRWWEPARPRQPAGLSSRTQQARRHGSGLRSTASERVLSSGGSSRRRDQLANMRSYSGLKKSARNTANVATPTEEDGDDDADLWSQGAVSSMGVLGRSLSGTSTASKHAAVAAQTKARIARERKQKEQQDQERKKALEQLKADGEHLDYGWPPSLKGSVY